MKSCIRFLAVLLVGGVPSLNSVVVAHPGHEHAGGSKSHSESAAESVAELSDTDRLWLELRKLQIQKLNTEPNVRLLALQTKKARPAAARPAIARFFDPFSKKIGVRWDEDYLYVESNGLPSHNMMVGITAWQQQVPFPQPFVGSNAWQIPLHPVPARNSMSAKTNFFRGAIALAVNGVPIFNPIKNDGRTDTLLAGELDQWGGHCGRADDYHYHIAPVHLEETVGKGKPLAFALDGYPIYGYEEADGSKPKGLELNSVAAVFADGHSLQEDFLDLNGQNSVAAFFVAGDAEVAQHDSPQAVVFPDVVSVRMLKNESRLSFFVAVDDVRRRSRSGQQQVAP